MASSRAGLASFADFSDETTPLLLASPMLWAPTKTAHFKFKCNLLLGWLGVRYKLRADEAISFMMTPEKRTNLYHLASQVIAYDICGDFVELGCHSGGTAIVLESILRNAGAKRQLHLFDSFEGLPHPVAEDGQTSFRAGDMPATPNDVLGLFERSGLRKPVIHPGWFEDTLATRLPPQIAFAHLDGDLYSSIACSLKEVWPRTTPGGILVIDDYFAAHGEREKAPLPGVKQACDEFFAALGLKVIPLFGGSGYGVKGHQAFIRKPIDAALRD